ncbi:EamA family transporter [Rhodobacterales bacterium HKCCE2091]|nr:EamA family transporter [Rhodobacterales bacterium HKCCE2091]
MLGAVFLFSAMDAQAKALSARYDVIEVVWARYVGQVLVTVLVLGHRAVPLLRTRHLGLQMLRSAFLFAATICFFTSLSHLPIASATAVMNIHPVLLTLGAALILGEPLGPRRIIGIAVALVGALIIIRPGSEVFSLAALLPLGAGICYASYALATRFLGRDEDILTSLIYTALLGAAAASVLTIPAWTTPDAADWGRFLALGVTGAAGQFLLIRALTVAEAGAVAPFGYSGVVFATLWGLLAFSEPPDAWTILGAVVIVSAGIYVWHRETRAPAPRRA